MTGAIDSCDDTTALEGLDLEALRSKWRARYGAPPSLRSPELLALMLAWRIQAESQGGLGSVPIKLDGWSEA